MLGRRVAIVGSLLITLWSVLAPTTQAQVVPRTPPIVTPPPTVIPSLPQSPTHLSSSSGLQVTPSLTPSLPNIGGSPVLDQRFTAQPVTTTTPSSPREKPTSATSTPALQVKAPSPPGSSTPDGGGDSPDRGSHSVPPWVFLLVIFLLWI